MCKKSGFTLVEILVASVIFVLIMAGLLSVFVAGTRHIVHARKRIIGSEIGKFFIDPFQNAVRQDTWGAAVNCLSITSPSGTYVSLPSCFTSPQTLDNTDFIATYQIDVPTGAAFADLRRVRAKISWIELTP